MENEINNINEIQEEAEPLTTVKEKVSKRIGKLVWNAFAIIGIFSLTAFVTGLTYSQLVFKDYTAKDFSNIKPIPGAPESKGNQIENPVLDITLPADYIQAALSPVPGINPQRILGAGLSLDDPTKRVLVFKPHLEEEISKELTATKEFLLNSDFDYECTPGDESYYTQNENSDAEIVAIDVCVRSATDREAHISGFEKINNIFYTLKNENTETSMILQIMTPGNTFEDYKVNIEEITKTYIWR